MFHSGLQILLDTWSSFTPAISPPWRDDLSLNFCRIYKQLAHLIKVIIRLQIKSGGLSSL